MPGQGGVNRTLFTAPTRPPIPIDNEKSVKEKFHLPLFLHVVQRQVGKTYSLVARKLWVNR